MKRTATHIPSYYFTLKLVVDSVYLDESRSLFSGITEKNGIQKKCVGTVEFYSLTRRTDHIGRRFPSKEFRLTVNSSCVKHLVRVSSV